MMSLFETELYKIVPTMLGVPPGATLYPEYVSRS